MPRSCQTTFFCYSSWKEKKKEQRGNTEAYRKYVENWTSTKENVQQWEEKLQETQLPKVTSTYNPRRQRKNQQTKEIPKIGDQNNSFTSTFVLKVLSPQKYNHFSHVRNSMQDMKGQTSCCYPFPMLFKLTFPNNNVCRTKQQVTKKLIIFFSFYLFFFLS